MKLQVLDIRCNFLCAPVPLNFEFFIALNSEPSYSLLFCPLVQQVVCHLRVVSDIDNMTTRAEIISASIARLEAKYLRYGKYLEVDSKEYYRLPARGKEVEKDFLKKRMDISETKRELILATIEKLSLASDLGDDSDEKVPEFMDDLESLHSREDVPADREQDQYQGYGEEHERERAKSDGSLGSALSSVRFSASSGGSASSTLAELGALNQLDLDGDAVLEPELNVDTTLDMYVNDDLFKEDP
jgi:hypothetical protein